MPLKTHLEVDLCISKCP